MDNNETPNLNGAPTPAQPIDQPVAQPTPQPAPQLMPQPTDQSVPQPTPQPSGQPLPPQPLDPAVDTSTNSNKSKKKLYLIIGCTVGAIAVIVIIVVLIILFLKGGNKTVSCTQQTTIMGIDIESKINVEVTKGKVLGGDMEATVNLKNLSGLYASHEQELVDSILETYQEQCAEDCKSDHEYVAGDHLTITTKYDEEGVSNIVYSYGVEDKSAQEIADKIQESLERSSNTTCKQN